METFFLENLQCEHKRLEAAQMMNFLKILIRGVLENQWTFGSLHKNRRKKKASQTSTSLSALSFFYFFLLLMSIMVFIKLFINDMVLVRAIISFSAVTLKSFCCDSC